MKTILSLAFTILMWDAAAQLNDSVFQYKTAVSVSPLAVIGMDYTALFGVEHRLKNKLSLTLDLGYVFYSTYLGRTVVNGTSGFNVRPGIKVYGKADKRSYVQFTIFYKHVNYKVYDWLGMGCVNGIPTYEKLQDFTFRKKTVSFNAISGRIFRLTDHILLEVYGGLGVKIKDQHPTEAAACYLNNEGGIFGRAFQEHRVSANVPVGVKMVIAVN